MKSNLKRRSNCPISCALDVIGDKWTLIILRDMLHRGKSRFEEFLASPERIASNVLTDRLHKMEAAGLIAKAPYGTHRLRMAYSPTEKGWGLVTVARELALWGRANFDDTMPIYPGGMSIPSYEAESDLAASKIEKV